MTRATVRGCVLAALLVACEDFGRTTAVVRSTCPFRCERDECIESWTECRPKWSEGGLCSDGCDMTDTYTSERGRYCTCRCDREGQCPTGQACKEGTTSICVPTCGANSDCQAVGFFPDCDEEAYVAQNAPRQAGDWMLRLAFGEGG